MQVYIHLRKTVLPADCVRQEPPFSMYQEHAQAIRGRLGFTWYKKEKEVVVTTSYLRGKPNGAYAQLGYAGPYA